MKREVYDQYVARVLKMFEEAHIVLSEEERKNVEIADFGLNEFETTGLSLVTYINTKKCCAKELVLFEGQTCPEHRHPKREFDDGKEETFRCRYGEVYLYVAGGETPERKTEPPKDSAQYYTAFHEIILRPGDQFTIPPNTLHWFQGGPGGAVVSEFSTPSTDESDVFTDPRIQRIPEIED